MFGIIIEIFLLGLIGGANPGPILTSIFTVVLNSNFKKSLPIIFKALIVETLVALLILLIVYALNLPQKYFYIISLAGAAVLIWLATQIWKINNINQESREIFNFSKIFLITILNGGFFIFWITICVPRAFKLRSFIPGGHFLFLFIFEFGWLIATLFLGYAFSKFRPLLQKRNLVSATFKVFSVLLVFFAVRTIYESVSFLLK